MDTTALREDHTDLRKKLALLDSAMQAAPDARLIVRKMCRSLRRALQEHMQREAPACAEAVGPSCTDHAAALQLLGEVHELLQGGMRASMPVVVMRLTKAIEVLADQMVEQEHVLFPALQHPAPAQVVSPAVSISCEMSVNEILQRYPSTAPVFQELQINRWREGYDCVDELAWRHGMDVEQLIHTLQQAALSYPHN